MIITSRLARIMLASTLAFCLQNGTAARAAEVWDMALPWGPKEFHTINAQKFAEKAKEITGGELTINVQAGGVLGIKGPETVRSVRDGIVPMADAPLSQAVGEVPISGVESLPYLMTSQEDLKALHGLLLDKVRDGLAAHNVKILYVVPWPASQIFSRRELKTPEDFKGLKVRAADSNAAQFFEAVGATPVQMPIADVLPSLASGALDATTTSMTTAADQKYWEFLKYTYVTNHLWTSNAMLVNMDSWNALSPEHQAALEKAAAEMQEEFWQVSAGEDAKAIEKLRAGGMQTLEPPAEIVSAMQAAARPVWDKAFERIGPAGKQVVDDYLKAVGRQ